MKSDTARMMIGLFVVLIALSVWSVLSPPRRAQGHPATSPIQATAVTKLPDAATKKSDELPFPAEPPSQTETSTVTMENQLLRVDASTTGGALKSIFLKRYQAELVVPTTDLLGTRIFAATTTQPAAAIVETLDLRTLPTRVAADSNRVEFTWNLPFGLVRKIWLLGPDYTLTCSLDLPPGTVADFDCMLGIRATETNRKEELANFHFCAQEANRFIQLSPSALRKKIFVGAPEWVGLKSKYFLLALISQHDRFGKAEAWALTDGRCGFRVATGLNSGTAGFTIYAGPLEFNRLRAFGLGLERMVGLGWMKPIALGIISVLRLFYTVFRNWGISIILFSVLMKALFYPLSRMQTRQMRQMQLLQPKINELKIKYKDNPQMLNQETMRLYRLYRVNPLSGCLPLLIQMPVFFALYAALRSFIELRGARFLWLNLSQPDTLLGHIPTRLPLVGGAALGLLPLLMGVSFIIQNLLTSTDKRNWMMIILFPIFITAIFLNLSSGLQLYWFVYNIVSIGESLIATRGGRLPWRKTRAPAMTTPGN